MTTTLQTILICHCRNVRHAISGQDRRHIRAAEQTAIAAGKTDLAGYYSQRLVPCPTTNPTPEQQAAKTAADLRNGVVR